MAKLISRVAAFVLGLIVLVGLAFSEPNGCCLCAEF